MKNTLRNFFASSLQHQLTLGCTLFIAASMLLLVMNLVHRQERHVIVEQRQ